MQSATGRIRSAERVEAHPIRLRLRTFFQPDNADTGRLMKGGRHADELSKARRRPLREHPNLRHLKDQAKDLFKAGQAKSLTEAQSQIARLYGFASWPKLTAHIENLTEIGALKASDRYE